VQEEFEISMMEELHYFFGPQVKQRKHGTFLSQSKYCTNLLNNFLMENYKESTKCYLDSVEKGTTIDTTKFRGLIRSP